jgi:hypothetical protein
MRRPKGGWSAPSPGERAKPVVKCRRCAKPVKARGLCMRHYQQVRRMGVVRSLKRQSAAEQRTWRESVFGRARVRLLGGYVKTLAGDRACPQCNAPTAWLSCSVCA